ncbi:serine/threonine-protein kinase [Nannocystis pusilla]|uniref:Serine/threonine protein kinase n=1 Tax=Nannocystis pusilla TaxID=889268 RepID=A0ABS7U2B5_9BACT|nr:serine/threonine protein kinase [Nannocystis pusilla]
MSQHETGRLVAARYRLERVLAQGGMGSIWVARHLQLDVDIAIKFMAPEFASSPDLRARFEREAKAAAMLKSPHAVQVHDYGIEDGAPYIVMELLEGEDLSARLAREERLSLPATRRIVEDVGKALRRAHEIGLIHRDMKPANIFLARQAGEEVVKIVDFGIAKSTGVLDADQPTQAGAVLGSPRYMSPEQVRSSAQVDHRTDLWSLGVIAFRCLTGRLPFPGGEVGEVFVAICTAPIPRASEVAPDLGPEVDRFFERALTRDVEQRFQSAAELVEAFAALPGAHDGAPGAGVQAWRGAGSDARMSGAEAEFLPTLPASGTLVPASDPRPDRRGRVALVIVGGVAALGLLISLYRRAPAPIAEPAPAEASATATISPPAPPAAEPPASPPAATPASPEPAPAAPPSAPADKRARPAGAAKPAPSSAKSRRSGAARTNRSDDLLKHM